MKRHERTRMTVGVVDDLLGGEAEEVDYWFDDQQMARLKRLGDGSAWRGLMIAVEEGKLKDMLREARQGPQGARERAEP